jgi:hypothetical protein
MIHCAFVSYCVVKEVSYRLLFKMLNIQTNIVSELYCLNLCKIGYFNVRSTRVLKCIQNFSF